MSVWKPREPGRLARRRMKRQRNKRERQEARLDQEARETEAFLWAMENDSEACEQHARYLAGSGDY